VREESSLPPEILTFGESVSHETSLARGKLAAGAFFVLNLLVLGIIGYLYAAGSAVAIDSIRAMTFRTGVWLVLFLGLAWLDRGRHAPGS